MTIAISLFVVALSVEAIWFIRSGRTAQRAPSPQVPGRNPSL